MQLTLHSQPELIPPFVKYMFVTHFEPQFNTKQKMIMMLKRLLWDATAAMAGFSLAISSKNEFS